MRRGSLEGLSVRKPIEERIRDFSLDPKNVMEALAMVKVGRDKGDSPEVIFAHVIGNILLRFHGIESKKPGQN